MQEFFNALYDFSFKEFVTIKIIKVIYGIGLLIAAIAAIGIIVNGFSSGFFVGILSLIAAPIVFVIYSILVRVWLEVVIVLFRISEDIREMVKTSKE